MPSPRVSVLTSVRNAAPYIDEAIASIRAQSAADWEWVIVDDGSDDGTRDRLRIHATRDRRLRILERPRRGIVASVNEGLRRCRAHCVARMDGDDIAHPDRLAQQAQALEGDPRLTAVDARVELIGGAENEGMHRYVDWVNAHRDHNSIAQDLFIESPLVNPATMFRRDRVVALGGYRAGDFPEDYDLWLRLYARGAQFAKLPERLLWWRDHRRRVTRTDQRYRSQAFVRVKQEHLPAVDGPPVSGEVAVWGVSRASRTWRQWLRRRGVTAACVVDQNQNRHTTPVLGARISAPEALRQRRWRYLLVTVSAADSVAQIRRQLQSWRLDHHPHRVRFV